jgi:hypothetical protein
MKVLFMWKMLPGSKVRSREKKTGEGAPIGCVMASDCNLKCPKEP